MKQSRPMLNLMLIACLLSGILAIGQQGTAAQLAGVDGNTYVSPTYGYSISWTDAWDLKPDYELVDADRMDRIAFGYHDVFASVVLEGNDSLGLDLDQCAQEVIDRSADQEEFQEDAGPVDAPPLEPAEGAVAHRAAFFFARDLNYLYAECRAIGTDGTGLRIVVSVPSRFYAQVQPDIVELLASIVSLPQIDSGQDLTAPGNAGTVVSEQEPISAGQLSDEAELTGPATQDQRKGGIVPNEDGDAARTGVMPGPGPAYVGAINTRWTFDSEYTVEYGVVPGSRAPVVANGIVFVGDDAGVLHALDGVTGEEVWSFETGADGQPALAVDENTVYAANQASVLYALDQVSGQVKWSADHLIGAEMVVDGGYLYISHFTGTGTVSALDPETGSELWRFTMEGENDFIQPPAASHGSVFVVDWQGAIYSIDSATGTLRWKNPGGSVSFPPVISNGKVLLASLSGDSIASYDESTGVLIWKKSANVSAPLAASERTILVSGTLLTALDSSTGQEVWQAGEIYSNPGPASICDGVVYVSMSSSLKAFDEATGQEIWSTPLATAFLEPDPGRPIVVDGTIYVRHTNDVYHELTAFEAGAPPVPALETGASAHILGAAILRAAPSAVAIERDQLESGAVVQITGDAVVASGTTWWPVFVTATGQSGWVEEQYLEAYFP